MGYHARAMGPWSLPTGEGAGASDRGVYVL